MKILLLADIHSNWPALKAMTEQFDACLFLGDLVDYATDPAPCVDWVSEHATAAIRGNHDHAVAQRIPAKGGNGFRALAAATRPLQWAALRGRQIKYLAQLPVTERIQLDDKSFFLVHATPRDPLDEYLADDRENWQMRLRNVEADFVCVGHTHVPYRLELDNMQIINPGSVGQPRDGDPRAAYAVIENGEVTFRRVEYNINATIDHMKSSGVDDDIIAITESVLKTGGKFPDNPESISHAS